MSLSLVLAAQYNISRNLLSDSYVIVQTLLYGAGRHAHLFIHTGCSGARADEGECARGDGLALRR